MDLDHYMEQMENNADTIQQMVRLVKNDQARWKPNRGTWSILEIINHLYDEEREDFRARLDIMLNNPEQEFAPWDPVAGVAERAYNERDITDSVNMFIFERQDSLRWLSELESPDWDAVYRSPNLEMTAGDMFAAWVMHDLLHMRQLIKLQWFYNKRALEPYRVDYAGTW